MSLVLDGPFHVPVADVAVEDLPLLLVPEQSFAAKREWLLRRDLARHQRFDDFEGWITSSIVPSDKDKQGTVSHLKLRFAVSFHFQVLTFDKYKLKLNVFIILQSQLPSLHTISD